MTDILAKAAMSLRNANRSALALQDFTEEATQKLAKGAISAPLAEIDKVLDIQKMHGNWNYDAYMHGLANGLIMARSCLTGEDPDFLEAPNEWLADRPDDGTPPETQGAPSPS